MSSALLPFPSPLPSSTPPAPVRTRRAALPSAPLSAHPVGRRRGGEVGVLGISQTPSGRDLERVGRQDALREQPKLAGAKGWVAVLRGLIGVRDQSLRPGVEGWTLWSLWALGTSRVRQVEGTAGTHAFPPTPFLDPRSVRTFLAQRRWLRLAPPLSEPPSQGAEPGDLPAAGALLCLAQREHPPRLQLPASFGCPRREAGCGTSPSCPGLEPFAACLSSASLPSPRLGKLRRGEGRKLAKGHRGGARDRLDRGSPPGPVPRP